ncbi:MAG: polymer-forming cytoskeletal protein, partial [Proteobacteria bacterium]|nr:polymer-forming cytoskeletal protein [Pseudomonadota bacterium]
MRSDVASPGAKAVIGSDLAILGDVRNAGEIEVLGLIKGTLSADRVIVHPGGRIIGTLNAASAEVQGWVEGRVRVKNLISIGSSGAVHGDVQYGQLALAPGGDLAAEVRNVPPELGGDFELAVRRGRSVRVTTEDINAMDPDDTP